MDIKDFINSREKTLEIYQFYPTNVFCYTGRTDQLYTSYREADDTQSVVINEWPTNTNSCVELGQSWLCFDF